MEYRIEKFRERPVEEVTQELSGGRVRRVDESLNLLLGPWKYRIEGSESGSESHSLDPLARDIAGELDRLEFTLSAYVTPTVEVVGGMYRQEGQVSDTELATLSVLVIKHYKAKP